MRRRSASRWTYNALADKDSLAGNPRDRGRRPDDRPLRRHVRPGHQRLRAAPERRQALDGVPVLRRGPDVWLKGYCNPIRYDDMVKRNVDPADLAAKLPDTTGRRPADAGPDQPRPRLITKRLGDRRGRRPSSSAELDRQTWTWR